MYNLRKENVTPRFEQIHNPEPRVSTFNKVGDKMYCILYIFPPKKSNVCLVILCNKPKTGPMPPAGKRV